MFSGIVDSVLHHLVCPADAFVLFLDRLFEAHDAVENAITDPALELPQQLPAFGQLVLNLAFVTAIITAHATQSLANRPVCVISSPFGI